MHLNTEQRKQLAEIIDVCGPRETLIVVAQYIAVNLPPGYDPDEFRSLMNRARVYLPPQNE